MKKVYYQQVDGLRGLLALMIVFFHIFCRYDQLYCETTIPFMENWGTYGVSVFFVISGYFMLSTHDNEPFDIISYLKEKLLRLWPMYVISVLIICVVLVVLQFQRSNLSILNIILNICLLNGFIGTPYIEGAHWYMTVLVAVIVLFGILKYFKIEKKLSTYICVLILSMLSYKCGNFYTNQLLGGGYIGIVFAGVALRLWKEKKQPLLLSGVVILSALYTCKTRGVPATCGMLVGIIVLWFTLNGKVKLFEIKIFRELGKISFPLYLIHQNIAYGIQLSLQEAFNMSTPFIQMVSFFAVVGLAYSLNFLSERMNMMIVRKVNKDE